MPHEPLYRPVLREAFKTTWRSMRLWPLALVAGILLSGSISDVVWRLVNALAPQASLATAVGIFWNQAMTQWAGFNIGDVVMGAIRIFQLSAFFLIIGFAIAGLSVICQGALVFALGTGRATKRLRIRDALTVGARAFWPLLVLNLLATSILIAVRSLLAMVVAIASNGGAIGPYLLYLTAFVVFVLVAAAATVIELFALNAMILQGATLAQGIERGARLLQRHWIVVFETAAILFALSATAWIAALLINGVIAIPLFILLMIAASLGSSAMVASVFGLGIVIFIVVLLALVAAVVMLHYATWTLLFRRLGEGGALPKVHRWIREMTHGYNVPGA